MPSVSCGRIDRQQAVQEGPLDERRMEARVEQVDRRVGAGEVVVGQETRERDHGRERRAIAEALERGGDGDACPAHRRVTLAADGDQREVALVRRDLLGGEADRVRVERAGEAAIGRDEHDGARPALALGEQRMVVAAEHGREVRQDLVDLVRVRSRRERGVLGALQLRRGDELHRARDLLDVAHRRNAASDLALAWHWWLFLERPGPRPGTSP